LQIEADQYAYTAASSTLGIRFPSWALEGGQEKISERLNDADTWLKIKDEIRGLLAERGLSDLSFAVVASHGANPALNGLSIKQVAAKLKGSESADAQLEAARDLMLAGGASMVYHFMSDDDVERIMRHPFVGIASDSSVLTPGSGIPHPRGYGNNARVLGEYVRQRGIISLEEAVRKMTSLPAQHFRFGERGVLAPGYAADVVIFDPRTVKDTATFEQPHAFAAGISEVLVNGAAVVRSGEHTGAKPGAVLAHSSSVAK
jgi:N-acyl-D-amino-acid deacylase